jgi:hypothetical protein
MKNGKFAGAFLIAGVAMPAAAQSIPDDVRCLALSNAFAKSAAEDPARKAASRSLDFYLGRLDARADKQAVASALRSVKIDPKSAPAEMTACSTRFAEAASRMQSLAKPREQGR